MKILITGANGLLGSDLVRELISHHELFGLGLGESCPSGIPFEVADITNEAKVREIISRVRPHVIIHTAAYRDADACEQNVEQAFLVNFNGTVRLAEAGNSVNAKFFFISSDYVFDGEKKEPYREEDPTNPLSVYGRSKVKAEQFLKANCKSAWIIRTSWLFGAHGRSFFRSILNAAMRGGPIRVVNDQRGAPTYTRDLAKGLRMMVEQSKPGAGCQIYHLTNAGAVTWFEAAQRLLAKIDYHGVIAPITSEEVKLNWPAPRPKNSVLNTDRIRKDFGIKLRRWEDAMDEFWDEILIHAWESQTKTR